MQHQTHIKLLSLVMVTLMTVTCVSVIMAEDESEAATDLGTLFLSSGENESSTTALYSGISGSAQDYYDNYDGDTIYVSEGARVTINTLGISPEYWSMSQTQAESWGLEFNDDPEGDFYTGNLSKTGTMSLLLAGEHDSTTIRVVVVADTTPVTSVSISGSTSGEVGDSITLTATTSPSSADDRHVTWTITSGSSYASIRSQTDTSTGGRCVIDLEGAGSVTVRATADDGSGEYDTHRITITEPEVLVSSVSISGSTTVNVGSSITLRATTSPSDADDRHVTWSITSGFSRVTYTTADTSTGGTITLKGVSAGTVTVRATADDGSGEYDTYTITVVQPAVNITTSQGDVTVITGQEFLLNVSTDVSGCTISVSGADWLDVSGSTVSGTPTSSGEYDITITATHSGYTSDSINFTITVVSALGFTNEPSNGVTVYVVS